MHPLPTSGADLLEGRKKNLPNACQTHVSSARESRLQSSVSHVHSLVHKRQLKETRNEEHFRVDRIPRYLIGPIMQSDIGHTRLRARVEESHLAVVGSTREQFILRRVKSHTNCSVNAVFESMQSVAAIDIPQRHTGAARRKQRRVGLPTRVQTSQRLPMMDGRKRLLIARSHARRGAI